MGIFKYKPINPVVDPKLPFFNANKKILFIPLKTIYNYYVEVVAEDGVGGIDYYILLSKDRFDINCRKTHTDEYGRVHIKVRGNLLDYIVEETKDRGNLIVEYKESTDDYDVFRIE